MIDSAIAELIIIICPRNKPSFDFILRRTITVIDRLRNKAIKTNKDSNWSAYRGV